MRYTLSMDKVKCIVEVGSKLDPEKCGDPAEVLVIYPESTSQAGVPMCREHAIICQDQTGAKIVNEIPYQAEANSKTEQES